MTDEGKRRKKKGRKGSEEWKGREKEDRRRKMDDLERRKE